MHGPGWTCKSIVEASRCTGCSVQKGPSQLVKRQCLPAAVSEAKNQPFLPQLLVLLKLRIGCMERCIHLWDSSTPFDAIMMDTTPCNIAVTVLSACAHAVSSGTACPCLFCRGARQQFSREQMRKLSDATLQRLTRCLHRQGCTCEAPGRHRSAGLLCHSHRCAACSTTVLRVLCKAPCHVPAIALISRACMHAELNQLTSARWQVWFHTGDAACAWQELC